MKSYITLLSSLDYLWGVLTLNYSLQKLKSKYSLGVLVKKNFIEQHPKLKSVLEQNGIRLHIIISSYVIPKTIENKIDNKRWRYSFDKLKIFGLTEFEKIVFLDSDMLVLQNIDHLFEKTNLSFATGVGNLQKYSTWTMPNSGLMVIKPEEALDLKIFETWNIVSKDIENFGDQNLINCYFKEMFLRNSNWLLSTKYNTLVFALDELVKEEAYNLNLREPNDMTISVLHFALRNRPWLMSRKEHMTYYMKNLIKGRNSLNQANWIYMTNLKKVKSINLNASELLKNS